MATVSFNDVTVQYPGTPTPSVSGLNLDIGDGEFIVLVGPSGCGKTTSLRALAGLEPVTCGSILIDGVDVTAIAPKRRDVAMVFQNYALYPNMTVAQNMGFALRNAKMGSAEIAERVAEASQMLELDKLLDRKPAKLSGGQRQRVAMGRAIVRHPKVFAMDEPLSNLDARLRVSTRAQISELQRRLSVTTIYVTHDQVEAMTMGDRVVVLKDGHLQQCAAPRELYDNPVNTFVATFIGSPGMNLFPASAAHRAVPKIDSVDNVTVGVRPESVTVGPEGAGGLPGTVKLVEELGGESLLYVELDRTGSPPATDSALAAAPQKPVIAKVGRKVKALSGDRVSLTFDPAELFYFDTETRARILF